MNETIHIACASDERYFPGLLATLSSVVINCEAGTFLTIHVIDGGINEESWKFLNVTLQKLGIIILKRYKPSLESFEGLPEFYYQSKLAYARLLLPKLLTESKVIYIDSDFLFLQNIRKLWNISLEGKSALVVLDTSVKYISIDCPVCNEFGFNPKAPYFNSGLMLMDLNRFRSKNIAYKAMAYLQDYPETCRFWDQSALNVALYDDFTLLEQEWNIQSIDDLKDLENSSDKLVAGRFNYHFITSFKPWLFYNNNFQNNLFNILMSEIGYSSYSASYFKSKSNYIKKLKIRTILPLYYNFRRLINSLQGQHKKAITNKRVANYWKELNIGYKHKDKLDKIFITIENNWKNRIFQIMYNQNDNH